MMRPDRKFLFAHPAHFVALGFGAGLMRRAPGTWGTLAALPLYFAVVPLGGMFAVAGLGVGLFLLGIWAADVCASAMGVPDHGGIVIDEIAAFLLVLAFTPQDWRWGVGAFVLFRLFDITKPWPISVADRRIKGGFGVMFDDLLAALFTLVCLQGLRLVF